MANEYLNNKNFESIIQSFQFHKREKKRYEMMLADFEETHLRRLCKYEDNERKERLDQAQTKYAQVCSAYKEHQDQLACAFYLLSENIARFYAKFSGIDVDDAIQEGVLICFEKIDRFDPRKGKAFNYMTTCILNNHRQLHRSARNYNELKRKYHTFLQNKLESVFLRNGRERSQNDRNFLDRE